MENKNNLREKGKSFKDINIHNINSSPQYDLFGNAGLPFLFGGNCNE